MAKSNVTKLLVKLMRDIADNMDAGNSELEESDTVDILNKVSILSNRDKRFSKYMACRYIGISGASFDNYVISGELPKGTKIVGFKELSWSQKTLDEFIEKRKIKKKIIIKY